MAQSHRAKTPGHDPGNALRVAAHAEHGQREHRQRNFDQGQAAATARGHLRGGVVAESRRPYSRSPASLMILPTRVISDLIVAAKSSGEPAATSIPELRKRSFTSGFLSTSTIS